MSTMEVGARGEKLASRYLEDRGYTILERNYRTRYGELDIIAKDFKHIVFVEVKTRRDSSFAAASDSVTPAKRRRLRATASLWLSQRASDAPTRFDVIEVYKNGDINHIPDAFI